MGSGLMESDCGGGLFGVVLNSRDESESVTVRRHTVTHERKINPVICWEDDPFSRTRFHKHTGAINKVHAAAFGFMEPTVLSRRQHLSDLFVAHRRSPQDG